MRLQFDLWRNTGPDSGGEHVARMVRVDGATTWSDASAWLASGLHLNVRSLDDDERPECFDRRGS